MTSKELLANIRAINDSLTALRQNRQLVKQQNAERIRSGEEASDVIKRDEPAFRDHQVFRSQYQEELKLLRRQLEELEREEAND